MAPTAGHPIRVVVAKPGLDGHDRGARVIARALRDAGMEVVYTGIFQTPGVDPCGRCSRRTPQVLGLSSLSGAHMEYARDLAEMLRDTTSRTSCSSSAGRSPTATPAELRAIGVAEVFGPGTHTDDVIEFIEQPGATRSAA